MLQGMVSSGRRVVKNERGRRQVQNKGRTNLREREQNNGSTIRILDSLPDGVVGYAQQDKGVVLNGSPVLFFF